MADASAIGILDIRPQCPTYCKLHANKFEEEGTQFSSPSNKYLATKEMDRGTFEIKKVCLQRGRDTLAKFHVACT